MTLDAKGKPVFGDDFQAMMDKRSRMVTIESWITISGRRRESYNLFELIELVDEYEQLINGHQRKLNEHLNKLVMDFNTLAVKPRLMPADKAKGSDLAWAFKEELDAKLNAALPKVRGPQDSLAEVSRLHRATLYGVLTPE